MWMLGTAAPFFFFAKGYLIAQFISIANQVLYSNASLTDAISTYGSCGHIITSSNCKTSSRNPFLWHPLLLTLATSAKEKKRYFYCELVCDYPDTAAVWSKGLPTRALKYTEGKGLRSTFRKMQKTLMCRKYIHKPCTMFIERPEAVFWEAYQ